MTSLSLPPYNYFFINFLTFTIFFYILIKNHNTSKNNKLFFIYGWSFGFGYFVTNLYWISYSLTYDINFKFLIPFTIIFIPSFLAIFFGLTTYFFAILKSKKNIASLLLFSLIFGTMEFIRGTILTGFPWNLIVYSFASQLKFLSIISFIGTYSLNLFCITLFTCPALMIFKKSKKNIGVCIFFVVTAISFHIFGSNYEKNFLNTKAKINDYKFRVIGSNISLDKFYSDIDPALIIQELIELSEPKINEKIIFIWPEVIIPNISHEELSQYHKLLEKNFSKNHFLILGVKKMNKKYFNTMSIYDDKFNLINYYSKINLVPFGEFLPAEKILKNIGLKSITNNYLSFSRGKERKILEINDTKLDLKILPLICYEIIYSGKLFTNPNFDLIVNISEDGWFGDTIGPEQHFTHSIFRAIESGKYIVRSSNNGIAAIINPLGVIEKKLKFGQSGYIDLEKMKKIKTTIFSIYGNKIFVLLILLYIFLIFSFNRIKNE